MKVLQINAVYGSGSTGLIVKDIEQILMQNGYSTSVVYQKASVIPKNGYRVGNPLDWKIHALATRIFGRQGYNSFFATKKMLRYIDKEKPDIVHLHNLHSNYINLKILLKYLKKKEIATVLTLHDCWFFTGKCFHFVECGCQKWQYGCGNCPQNKLDVKSIFFDQSKKVLSDKIYYFQQITNLTIVGCSVWIKELAKRSPVFQGKKIISIYNGVDTKVFYPRKDQSFRKTYSLDNKFVILGMANKWLQKRNIDMLAAIEDKIADNEVIVIVGCTKEQKRDLEGKRNIISIGYIENREELADIYASSDVFVNLTFEDTLPTVNMESICCGTPVITYDSCGSPELILEGQTGYVISKNSSEELRVALDKVKRRLIEREKCAEIGKLIFDKNNQYEKYLELYKSILDGKVNI